MIIKMPFVSEAQRRACYAKKDPRWDCKKWEQHTKRKLKICGAKCLSGKKCKRKTYNKRCYQHK